MEPTQEEVARRDAELDESAREYYRSLPVEDTIDTVPQANARRALLSSFRVIKAKRPDLHYFNELLIEYRTADGSPGRVVPNNFVTVHPEPIKAGNSFDLSEQPTRPLLALEYVTEYRRPEFKQNRAKYERDLRIPYYLRVYPHDGRIAMYSLRDDRYTAAQLNAEGRFAVPELESEFGVVDGAVRVWFRGELVPLIAERGSNGTRHSPNLRACEKSARPTRNERSPSEEQRAPSRRKPFACEKNWLA